MEKTTYTAPAGADPNASAGSEPVATARVRSGGLSPLAWVAIVIAIIILAIYGLGLVR